MVFRDFLPHLHKWQHTLLCNPNYWCDAITTFTQHTLSARAKVCLGSLSLAYINNTCDQQMSIYYDIEIPTTDHQFLGVVQPSEYKDIVFEYFYYEFDPIQHRILVFNEFECDPIALDIHKLIVKYTPDDLKLQTIRSVLVQERIMTEDDVLLFRDLIIPNSFVVN